MEDFLEEFQHLKIRLEEIRLATSNFDKRKVIGNGGFGKVYEGELSHSKGRSIVAFKRLDRYYGQGDAEFLKEIIMLTRYTHENLISLLGFCDEDGEKILVFEHASHGSLDHHLSSTTLTWRQRLEICIGAATGLCSLHDPKGTQLRVLHRDIKSSNILLDKNWNAKVSDMGLSKVGPANQHHTFLATNVVGTFGYVDPTYMETSILTKESDVYSFGVVLFEVLCGRLCFENKDGHLKSLVPMWKKSYKQETFKDIIFEDLKQHMDPRSFKTFSDIAYQCLHKSSEKRPLMSQVADKLKIALWFQEIFQEISMVPPLVYRSEEELRMLLSKGIFVNGGKTWFMLNKNEEYCVMISAAESLIPIQSLSSEYRCRKKSRFPIMDYRKPYCLEFKTHVRTHLLSPQITYTVNLVFDLYYRSKDFLGLNYILAGDTKSSTSYLAHKRDDGWFMAELYQFTSQNRNVDLEITFRSKDPLAVEGIEFQPLDIVEPHLLEDEEVDRPTISHSDTYWELKLPTDYEDMIKWSRYTVQWKTKKELYYILRKGFSINNGEEWLSVAKNGKKCHTKSARVSLRTEEWRWQSLPESRFEEVAFDPCYSFCIDCRSKILSVQTTYATYLVYKLQENHSIFEYPVNVSVNVLHLRPEHSWYIYLLSHQTPIIRGKIYQNTHNPLNRPKMKGVPQQRNDGWMEVQIWEFSTDTTSPCISKELRFTLSYKQSLKGLIVQGIEFKPI